MFYNEKMEKEIASLNREIDLNNILEVEIQMEKGKNNTVYVQITKSDFGDSENHLTDENIQAQAEKNRLQNAQEEAKEPTGDVVDDDLGVEDDDLDVEDDILDDDDF